MSVRGVFKPADKSGLAHAEGKSQTISKGTLLREVGPVQRTHLPQQSPGLGAQVPGLCLTGSRRGGNLSLSDRARVAALGENAGHLGGRIFPGEGAKPAGVETTSEQVEGERRQSGAGIPRW